MLTGRQGRRRILSRLDRSAGGKAGDVKPVVVIARSGNMSGRAHRAGMSRDGLDKALSDKGNPTGSTVLRDSEARGLKLSFQAVA